MKIAIHHRKGSFSDRWFAYCTQQGIDCKLVNCYETDIMDQLKDCDVLMWHHSQIEYKDVLFAKQLLSAVAQSGKKTFPDYKTGWHFDDKVGQKYLFESIEAPLVPSYVFYTREEVLKWIDNTIFPKVFKLRGGAGSENVKLVNSSVQAKKLVKKAFGTGFTPFDRLGYLKERIRQYKEGKSPLMGVIKGLGRLFIPTEFARMHGREKGYIYFQDFIPNNQFDIRVVVIFGKAFAAKRMVRKNDFRASGSGNILYEKEHLPIDSVKLAFQLSVKLQTQCVAFDFVYNEEGNPLVIEMSYGFPTLATDLCIGYWDESLQFHEGPFTPQNWIVEALINKMHFLPGYPAKFLN